MISTEGEQRRRPSAARRSEDDLRRRQALLDAATGISPHEVDVLGEHRKIKRFRCVIYLCAARSADITELRSDCVEYAEAFCWEITDVIEDHAVALPPEQRDGLKRALDRIQHGEAGAVLTAFRSMISQLPQEYDRVAREIERAGGFLHVKGSARGEHHPES
jgi:hypothetical protein